jgi:hypothetical protein
MPRWRSKDVRVKGTTSRPSSPLLITRRAAAPGRFEDPDLEDDDSEEVRRGHELSDEQYAQLRQRIQSKRHGHPEKNE